MLKLPVDSTWPLMRCAVNEPSGAMSSVTDLPSDTRSAVVRDMASTASLTMDLSSGGTTAVATATADSLPAGMLAEAMPQHTRRVVKAHPSTPWPICHAQVPSAAG